MFPSNGGNSGGSSYENQESYAPNLLRSLLASHQSEKISNTK